jgi:hypothetical protein
MASIGRKRVLCINDGESVLLDCEDGSRFLEERGKHLTELYLMVNIRHSIDRFKSTIKLLLELFNFDALFLLLKRIKI